ncbi:MAG: hypothetical protein II951_05060, partial [Bacteroidales bacterium]|nr:hypothetical protein [Bacteroidales bacterium]
SSDTWGKASHRGHGDTEEFRTQRRAGARRENTEGRRSRKEEKAGVVTRGGRPHTEGTETQRSLGHRGELALAGRTQGQRSD